MVYRYMDGWGRCVAGQEMGGKHVHSRNERGRFLPYPYSSGFVVNSAITAKCHCRSNAVFVQCALHGHSRGIGMSYEKFISASPKLLQVYVSCVLLLRC
jgi:hypothetical protein